MSSSVNCWCNISHIHLTVDFRVVRYNIDPCTHSQLTNYKFIRVSLIHNLLHTYIPAYMNTYIYIYTYIPTKMPTYIYFNIYSCFSCPWQRLSVAVLCQNSGSKYSEAMLLSLQASGQSTFLSVALSMRCLCISYSG